MSKVRSAQKTVLAMDLRACIYLNHWSVHSQVAGFFQKVSRLGDGAFWYAMLLLVGMIRGFASLFELGYVLLVSGFGTLLYKILKQKTVRPRPYQVHQVIRLGERPLDHFSFPSGHTLHALMFSVLLGSMLPLLLWIMLPFSLLIALSRIILGLHYPSDVLLGGLLGLSVASCAIALAPTFGLSL